MNRLLFILAAAVLVAGGGLAYLFLRDGGAKQDLSERERFGRSVVQPVSATSTASSSLSAVLNTYSNAAAGFSFRYPDNLEIRDLPARRDGGVPVTEFSSGPIQIAVSEECISEPETVSDATWEHDFSKPDFTAAVGFEFDAGTLLQNIEKPGGVNLFVFRKECRGCGNAPEAKHEGFSALACASGPNRGGFTAGRCFKAATGILDPQSPEHGDLQRYFLDEFVPSLEFGGSFRNVAECRGLNEGSIGEG